MRVNWGKWTKHKVMETEERLSVHLPETRLFSGRSLWIMLDRHQQVMVKPSVGSYGRGILQVTDLGNNMFEIHDVVEKITFPNREETLKYITEKHSERKSVIVQQKIHLALINDAPFDIRVMVQRRKGSKIWNVTGKLCKVAVQNFIVTNVAKKLLTVEEGLARSSVGVLGQESIIAEIDRVSLLAAATLEKHYPKRRTLGFDIGIDQSGHVWIIEVNLMPVLTPFARLSDKTMLQTILSYDIKNPRLPPSFKMG